MAGVGPRSLAPAEPALPPLPAEPALPTLEPLAPPALAPAAEPAEPPAPALAVAAAAPAFAPLGALPSEGEQATHATSEKKVAASNDEATKPVRLMRARTYRKRAASPRRSWCSRIVKLLTIAVSERCFAFDENKRLSLDLCATPTPERVAAPRVHQARSAALSGE